MATDPTRRPKANPKAAIQDWLTLVDPDGAFLTPSELNAVFPHGFEQMDRDLRTELRARVADLAEADDPTTRSDLRRWLLGTTLDWDDLLADGQRIPATATVRAAEHGVTLRPAHVLLDADDANRVRLGVFTWPLGTPLDRRTDITASGDTWPASPVQRAETWCRESGTPLALVTDDDTWTLVWAPRGAPAASGTWAVSDLADETILQSGLVSLLGARRFFAVSDEPKTGETLERLFERAADAEAELTKGLGASVRQSVELLVAAISRDHVASDGKVLADVAGTEVYESAVTVLMRLVFLLFAEERRLLPAEDPLWAESYSVLTLRDDLRQAATRDGLDALERRSTAWHRLLATFRAVHGGVNHDRLTLPAYGGSLFDPDRFPFLEGRRTPDHLIAGGVDLGPAPDAAVGPGRPVAIDDRTVLAILDSLLTVQVKSGRTKVAQRVSYKALDVEQIGHCYEGLLDHGAIPIDELALGLVGPEGGEPEITVAELDAFDDWDDLCEWLSDKTRCNKKASALAKLLDQEPVGVELARLRVACGH
ncbi:MAG TPA: restriction endonuclease, partial [Acidimicrobiaceae bacterium]|nr:restriction endonuclease [Acidimicrobiaceae bacterium]